MAVQPLAHPRTGRARIASFRFRISVAVATVVAFAVLGLVGITVWIAFRTSAIDGRFTLDQYRDLFGDSFAAEVALNTLWFALVTLVVAMAFGVPIAWLVERTTFRGKTAIYTLMTAGILIPGFFAAMGWLFLLNEHIGILNGYLADWFGFRLNIVSIVGMGFVQGLALAPLAYVLTASILRAIDPTLEEAAHASGAPYAHVMRKVTLPLVTPGLLGAAIFLLVISFGVFDVPAIIGLSGRIFLFSTYVYEKLYPLAGRPNYGAAGAFSTMMIVVALVLGALYVRVIARGRRYEVIGARATAPRLLRLGRWQVAAWAFVGVYFSLSLLLPLLMLIWISLIPYLQLPSRAAFDTVSLENFRFLPWDAVREAFGHTLLLMTTVPTAAMALSIFFSWVVLRTRFRARFAYDFVAFLPQAVPHSIFGFAAIVAVLFVLPPGLHLYGTITLLAIVMALSHLGFGTRLTNGALIQINRELEEAASSSGAPIWYAVRRIVLPLLRPALVYGWLWVALLTFRELTLPTLMASPQNQTLSVVVYSLQIGGGQGQAAALALIIVAIMLPLVLVFLRAVNVTRGGVRA